MEINQEEEQYLSLLKRIIKDGEQRQDRTGVGTFSLFSASMSFSLKDSFPLLTTKKLHFKSIAHELLWFLRGDTNTQYLKENNVSIWDEWADEKGEVGPIYGFQWRRWPSQKGGAQKGGAINQIDQIDHIDQIAQLLKSLQDNPFSRRHILSAWNVGEIANMALPPCHLLAQFYVSKMGGLSCQFYQRSVDAFLGLPFNIASYALLTYLLAKITNLFPEKLYFIGGDVHLYNNHIEQAKTQIERKPFLFPSLYLKSDLSLEKLKFEDISLQNYKHHSSIKAPIAI